MTSAPLRRLPAAPVSGEAGAGVVVVGSGAAGLSAALEAAGSGADVLVVTKGTLGGGSTQWAQGGLAASLGPDDSPGLHAGDTLIAGAGLCDPDAVGALVGSAPGEVRRLTGLGARWDGGLGLEGGHRAPRIVHAGGDASGAEVQRVLSAAARREVAAGRLRLWEATVAIDVVVAGGAVAGLLVGRPGGRGQLEVVLVHAAGVVVATGGFGQAYSVTTNPLGVTGDGLALAARAGAEVSDLEFVQFHPTVLWQAGRVGRRPLVTEALRGAGARLVDGDGAPVMAGAHPAGDLAPRDVVSAAMAGRMAAAGVDHLWLDARSVGRERLEQEFPTVTAACRAAGTEPADAPIPVSPGAHYACGGVRADADGATSLPGLWAVGEAAGTGVHGANRLASNSLTEALAAGRRVGRLLAGQRVPAARRDPGLPAPGEGADPAHRSLWASAMSAHVGVLRNGCGLEMAAATLAGAPPAPLPLSVDVVEAVAQHTAATLVVAAAAARTESRGCHRRSDFPLTDQRWERHLVLAADGDDLAVKVGAPA
jgi:L-aspartate oxidase